MKWSSIRRLATRIYEPPWTSLASRWFQFYDTIEEAVPSERSVHGFLRLKKGFSLAHVPYDAVVQPMTDRRNLCDADTHPMKSGSQICNEVVSATYSGPKAIVAIAQLAFAVATLYKSSGTEVAYYGYSAYGEDPLSSTSTCIDWN